MFNWRLFTTFSFATALSVISAESLSQPAAGAPGAKPAATAANASVRPAETSVSPSAVQAELQRHAAQLKALEEANAATSMESLQIQRDQLKLARDGHDLRIKEYALQERNQALQREAASHQSTGVILQFFSSLFLLVAVYQAARAAMLTRWNTQVHAFLQLRDGFSKLRPHLPQKFGTDFEDFPASHEEMRASIRYWHHAFDEWFATQRVHPLTLGRLWRVYYRTAILANRKSPFMVAALLKAKELSSCPVDEDFVEIVLGQTRDRTTWEQIKAWARKFDERPGLPEEIAASQDTRHRVQKPPGQAQLPQVLERAKALLADWDATEERLRVAQPKKAMDEGAQPAGTA